MEPSVLTLRMIVGNDKLSLSQTAFLSWPFLHPHLSSEMDYWVRNLEGVSKTYYLVCLRTTPQNHPLQRSYQGTYIVHKIDAQTNPFYCHKIVESLKSNRCILTGAKFWWKRTYIQSSMAKTAKTNNTAIPLREHKTAAPPLVQRHTHK